MTASTEKRDYYKILHVSHDAPLEIIRSTYRTLMQKLRHHPDLGGDTETAALINEAYAVLSNAEQRAEYDAYLDLRTRIATGIPEQSLVDEPAMSPIGVPDPFRECVFCGLPHACGEIIDQDACCASCHSPLAVAKSQRLESACQRSVARIDKNQSVVFYTHWPQRMGFKGRMEDISLNGLCLVTARDLKRGQRIKIVSDVLEAVADVTHSVFERRGWETVCVAGVSFTTLRFMRSVGGFVSSQA